MSLGSLHQHTLASDPHWINFTPGIKLEIGNDGLGQQYVTPDQAIREHGSDVIIVGRGIMAAKNPLKEAEMYRYHGWESYLKRCKK